MTHAWMQEKLQAQWHNLKQTLSKQEGLPASSEAAVDKLLKECTSAGADSLCVEVSLVKAAIHLKIWRDEVAASGPVVRSAKGSTKAMHHAVQVWHIISRLWNGRAPGEPGILLKSRPDDAKSASGMLADLGFAEAALRLSASAEASSSKPSKRSSSQAALNRCGMDIFR